jgi:hypothetical protein
MQKADPDLDGAAQRQPRPLQAGTQLNISVYVSPRLWSDTPQVMENLEITPISSIGRPR